MYKVRFDTKKFNKDMRNLIAYSEGFLDGAMLGRQAFLNNFGQVILEGMKQFIDSMAKVDPQLLHHVYEWNQTGSPSARLYDLSYVVSPVGLSINATFRQSTSIKDGSKEPFYDKARIMEAGLPIQIRPKESRVLVFEENGETVFTTKPVTVRDPGGPDVKGGFNKTLDTFFNQYFTQAFLISSGIIDKLKDLSAYKKNLNIGIRMGRSKGREAGFRWIVQAGVIK